MDQKITMQDVPRESNKSTFYIYMTDVIHLLFNQIAQ